MKNIVHSQFSRFGLACAGIVLALVAIRMLTGSVAFAQQDTAQKVVTYKVVAMNPSRDPLEAENPLLLQGRLTTRRMEGGRLVAIDHSYYIFSK